MTKRSVSLSAMNKILRGAGAERVADSAKEALAEVLEEKGKEIAKEAIKFSQHAGRKTVMGSDVKLALKQ